MAVDKEEVLRLYKEGVNKRQIAKQLKCSRKYIYDVLAQYQAEPEQKE